MDSDSPPSHSSVVQELNHLAEAGVLCRMHAPGRDTYLERRTSIFWEMCRQLREEVLARRDPADVGAGHAA